MLHTRKIMSDEAIKSMAERNAKRIAITKRSLCEKYAHHQVNQVQRKPS